MTGHLRFLLDMGISANLALWLRGQGYDAVHLNDEYLFKLDDILILEKAIQENRIIITADMDFGHLLALNQSKVASVIQFRTSNFTPDNVKVKLLLLLEKFADQMNEHFIITVEDKRMRFRRLPF